MPPKSSVKPEWTIENFGAMETGAAPAADRTQPQGSAVESAIVHATHTDRKRKITAPASRRAR